MESLIEEYEAMAKAKDFKEATGVEVGKHSALLYAKPANHKEVLAWLEEQKAKGTIRYFRSRQLSSLTSKSNPFEYAVFR